MAAITQTTRPATAIRPAAMAPQAPAPTREQKLELARDRFETTRNQAQRRIEDGFGAGVKCSRVAEDAGHAAGRAVGSVVGAGGKDDAPAVLGEVGGFLLTAPVCYAGALANSFVQQGIMLAAKGNYKLAEMKDGH
ncbi:MAG TPA: hypothetical protein V6D05_00220 [Stenomitos sp.]